jgi:flagellar motor component MotA
VRLILILLKLSLGASLKVERDLIFTLATQIKLTVMKNQSALFLVVSMAIWNFACKDDGEKVDPVTVSLVETLNQELVHLTQDPAQWIDDQFLRDALDLVVDAHAELAHIAA